MNTGTFRDPQSELASQSRKLGQWIAQRLTSGVAETPADRKLRESEREIISELIMRPPMSVDQVRIALEAVIGSLSLFEGKSYEPKYARQALAVAAFNERKSALLESSADSPSADELISFIEASANSLLAPKLPDVLMSLMKQVARHGPLSPNQKEQLGSVMRKAYPRYDTRGREAKHFRSDGADIPYLELQISYFTELARHARRRQLIAESAGLSDDDIPLGRLPANLVHALALNGTDHVIAKQVARQPLSVVQPILDRALLIQRIRRAPHGAAIAIAQTIVCLYEGGLTCLFASESVHDDVGQILDAMRRALGSPKDNDTDSKLVDRALSYTAIDSFSSRGDVAASWRFAWKQAASSSEINARLTGDDPWVFLTRVIQTRLSPYGRLMFDEAESLFNAAFKAHDKGNHYDGGLVCLAYMRVLEVEFNEVIRAILRTGVRIDWDGSNSHLKSLAASVVKMQKKPDVGLTMGDIRHFFGKLKKDFRAPAEVSELSQIFTETGMAAFGSGELTEPISDEACKQFRNPPAHASFLDWSAVERCRQHVRLSLFSLNGSSGSEGPVDGWIKR